MTHRASELPPLWPTVPPHRNRNSDPPRLRDSDPPHLRIFDPSCLRVTTAPTCRSSASPPHLCIYANLTYRASDRHRSDPVRRCSAIPHPPRLHITTTPIRSLGIKCLSVDKKNGWGFALNHAAELFPLPHPCFCWRTNDLVSNIKWLSNSLPDSILGRMTEFLK
jgi:hypothetical protein